MKPKNNVSTITGPGAEQPKGILAEKCKIFGENMRAARKERGFTSEALGRFLGISTAYVGLIERGERTPSLETFLKICDFFGESPDDMFRLQSSVLSVKEKKASGRSEQEKLERKRKLIAGMIHTFSLDELDHVITVIKSFKSYSHKSGADHQDEMGADGLGFTREGIRGLV